MATEYEEETQPLHNGEDIYRLGEGLGSGSDHSQHSQQAQHRVGRRASPSIFSTGTLRKARSSSRDDNSLPSWVAPTGGVAPSSPQSNPDLEYDSKPRNTLVFTANKRKSTFSFAMMGFMILGLAVYSSARSSLGRSMEEINGLIDFSARLSNQMKEAELQVRRLERELAALDAMEQEKEEENEEKAILQQAALFANPSFVREMSEIENKLSSSMKQAEGLKQQVSMISKRDARAKYGSGNIRVEIELVFQGANLAGPTVFVLEMAPIDLMPHSVYTFLEMTSRGLLDGCSFILNAMHVIKAAPLPYDGGPPQEKAKQFLESGLESVAFREYSEEYPHTRYTMGFAADGSPSFYINTEDNTQIHVGDPCFAKIVSGFDAIKRMESSPTRNGLWFENRIGIKKATIL